MKEKYLEELITGIDTFPWISFRIKRVKSSVIQLFFFHFKFIVDFFSLLNGTKLNYLAIKNSQQKVILLQDITNAYCSFL